MSGTSHDWRQDKRLDEITVALAALTKQAKANRALITKVTNRVKALEQPQPPVSAHTPLATTKAKSRRKRSVKGVTPK